MSQVRKQKPSPQKREPEQEAPRAADQEETREQIEHTDEFLDDVDALLEEVGTDTAKNFKQKGGQAVDVVRGLVRKILSPVRNDQAALRLL